MGVGAIVRTGLAAVVVAAATGAASGAVVAVEAAVPATALRGDATAYDGGVFASLDRRGAGAVAARAGVRAGAGPRPHVHGRRAAAVAWAFLPDLSDEWDGSRVDTAKWRDYNPIWYGRAPAAFSRANVYLWSGILRLEARFDPLHDFPPNPPGAPAEPRLYGNWTSAYVESTKAVRYGFFEVRSRPSDSIFSSSFWLSSRTQTDWTELDVYEIGGGAPGGPGPGFPYLVFSNAHVFRRTGTAITPETVVSSPANYVAKERLSSSWHTYALQWEAKAMHWYFDGRRIRTLANEYHQLPLQLKLDAESFPTWFGLPSSTFTTTQYRVAYVRSWAAANGRSRTGRRGTAVPPPEDRVTPYVTPAAALPTDDDTSPYQLGRAPPPGDKRDPTEAAGRAAAVPRRGWDAYRVRRGARAGASGERGPLVDVPPAETGVPPAGAGSFPSASPLPSAVVAPTAAGELVVATSPANPEAPSEATTPFSGACVPARPVPSSSPLPRDETR